MQFVIYKLVAAGHSFTQVAQAGNLADATTSASELASVAGAGFEFYVFNSVTEVMEHKYLDGSQVY